LGHVISAGRVTTDPEKIVAVKDWPIPHNKKQLRSFLGFSSYYRKFVKGIFFDSETSIRAVRKIKLNIYGMKSVKALLTI